MDELGGEFNYDEDDGGDLEEDDEVLSDKGAEILNE